MNQEQSIRTISVRYTLVFCVIIGFLFLFSQILDNLFYDYTVIETEIVFIKRVGTQNMYLDESDNNIIIELNEVTETSNSLVLTLQNNMQNTIEQIYKKISYHVNEEDDLTLQQTNSQYRQQYNLISHSLFIQSKQPDSIYILNIKNTLNSEIAEVGNNNNQSIDITMYSDVGANFYDLAQTITLNNYWNEEFSLNFKNKVVTKYIENQQRVLLIFYDYITNYQQVALIFNNQITIIYETSNTIVNVALTNNNIILEQQFDRNLHQIKYAETKWEKASSLQFLSSAQFYQILKLFYINDTTVAILYIEASNEKYYLIGSAYNEFKNVFLKIDITDDMVGIQTHQISLLYDYDAEHNILVLSFCKKHLFYLKFKSYMLNKFTDQWNPRKIKLQITDLDKENFKKILYSHDDQQIYILSESAQQKFKMYLVDLTNLEDKDNKIDTLKLRMPYFRQGMVAKDFQLKKNQINNIVILFLLRNGDVACIQPLQYGEGVLKKTFIIELLDIILTLSFIGFFRYLKRLLQKIYQKIISCCRRM